MQQIIKSLDELPAMLNVCDIKTVFGIGRRQAYELVHSEGFPVVKVGVILKIPKHLLVEWIDKTAKEGAGEC